MSKKITPISEEELIRTINEEGLGNGHPYESELDMCDDVEKKMQLPGTIGTTRNASGECYLCYCVDGNGRMTKISTHNSFPEAYGMALRRYREAAKEPGYVKPDGESFTFGPVSSWRDKENDRYANTRGAIRAAAEAAWIAQTSKNKKAAQRSCRFFDTVDGIEYEHESVFYEKQENWKCESFYGNKLAVRMPSNIMAALNGVDLKGSVKPFTDILLACDKTVAKVTLKANPGSMAIRFRTSGQVSMEGCVPALAACIRTLAGHALQDKSA